MAEGTETRTGSCLCGGVHFSISGSLRDVSTCHCAMCRRATTSVGAYTACASAAVTITGRKLRWYRSSPEAERGFCSRCGAQLFWRRLRSDAISVSAGSLDDLSGLTWGEHIHVSGSR